MMNANYASKSPQAACKSLQTARKSQQAAQVSNLVWIKRPIRKQEQTKTNARKASRVILGL